MGTGRDEKRTSFREEQIVLGTRGVLRCEDLIMSMKMETLQCSELVGFAQKFKGLEVGLNSQKLVSMKVFRLGSGTRVTFVQWVWFETLLLMIPILVLESHRDTYP
jgi:hypothetical protein